ncbi:MAG: peptidylprolyl isomerase [Ilumatobacteraceae bacterium]
MATEKRERQRANRSLRDQHETRATNRQTRSRRLLIGVAAVVGGVAFVLLLAWCTNRGGDDDNPSTTATTPTVAPGVSTTVATTVAGDTSTTTGDGTATTSAGFAYGSGECPPIDGASEPVKSFDVAPQLCIDPAATYSARFVTDRGDVVVTLDAAERPGAVNNFVTLARYGYYDDTLLFRTNTSIEIVQGGGRTNTDSPGYQLQDEGDGFTYAVGEIAMARTPQPNSAGGQWFFIVGDAGLESLASQGTYVSFGEVTEGLDVLEEVLALAGDDGDTPTEDVVLETVEITET